MIDPSISYQRNPQQLHCHRLHQRSTTCKKPAHILLYGKVRTIGELENHLYCRQLSDHMYLLHISLFVRTQKRDKNYILHMNMTCLFL